MTDDIESMEVSGYLCTLASAGVLGVESSRNIYVPTENDNRVSNNRQQGSRQSSGAEFRLIEPHLNNLHPISDSCLVFDRRKWEFR